MALPKEPRQKMINIMYLVLTAMLAINISAEILNAFKTVNTSLETTNTTINASTTTIMKSLEEKKGKAETAEKATIWYAKAQSAANLTKGLYDYINGLKGDIIKTAGGDPSDPNKTFNMESQSIATKIMIENGKGKELLKRLTDYKTALLAIDPLIQKEMANDIQINLETPKSQDGKVRAWDITYFNMVPTIASLTILSKFQNDIKTSENKVVAFCHQQVGKVDVVFDSYAPIVGQNSNYLMPGQELTVTAGIGAFAKGSAQPTISVGGQTLTLNADGLAEYKTQVNNIGPGSLTVNIRYFDQSKNAWQETTKKIDYTVGQANASIALDKMNVLYIGVDNPITVAASGAGADKIQVSVAGGGGSVSGSGSKRVVRVTSVTDDCRITVSVDGKVAGASQFRVRTIPRAQAYIGGNESGANIAAGAFRAQQGVGAGIKDFPFELSYTVTSFSFSIDTDDGDIVTANCQGNTFSAAARSYINAHVKAGKTVTIDGIRVLGPDGRTSPAPSLVYYIK